MTHIIANYNSKVGIEIIKEIINLEVSNTWEWFQTLVSIRTIILMIKENNNYLNPILCSVEELEEMNKTINKKWRHYGVYETRPTLTSIENAKKYVCDAYKNANKVPIDINQDKWIWNDYFTHFSVYSHIDDLYILPSINSVIILDDRLNYDKIITVKTLYTSWVVGSIDKNYSLYIKISEWLNQQSTHDLELLYSWAN